jgi:beta-lactamase class C
VPRRLLLVLLIALAGIGLVWAGMLWLSTPTPTSTVAAPAGVELRVGENATARVSNVDYRRLDERLTRLMADPAMVGLAVAVVEDGRISFIKGYGRTHAGGEEPVTTRTVFRWASLSKGVAADMVALLAHEGQLSLGDPVSRWAPSMRLPSGNEYRATVADILSHRTGLFGHAQDARLEDGQDPRWLRMGLASLHNICAPGTCHAYQNVAFDAASEMVERVTGRPYGDEVIERLFRPLGMRNASFGRAALMASPSWARAHVGGDNPRHFETTEPYYRVPAAGGVNGTIEDLAIWMIAQMGAAPEILPAEVLQAVQAPRVPTPGETRRRRAYAERTPVTAYGLGWRAMTYAGHRVIGHHGGVRGYRSLILFDPERRSGVVALWNASIGIPNGIEYEVMDMIYGLPFRDWLRLDTPEGEAPVGEEAAGNELAEGN